VLETLSKVKLTCEIVLGLFHEPVQFVQVIAEVGGYVVSFFQSFFLFCFNGCQLHIYCLFTLLLKKSHKCIAVLPQTTLLKKF
jgi:hypothetical protein